MAILSTQQEAEPRILPYTGEIAPGIMINRLESAESSEKRVAVPVTFFKLGGTWDMVFRDGRKVGSGTLDDDKLRELESKLGCYERGSRSAAERKLASILYDCFREAHHEQLDTSEHLSTWARSDKGEQIGSFVSGPFIPLFSGDSSHFRSSIVAPMLAILIDRVIRESTKPILGGQGTDTADIALLAPFDALTFDTLLPPLILAGANRSHNENNSDAPRNFLDLARVARTPLSAGAYWVFQGNLYNASDLVKIDPEETRRVEGQSTFLAPHKTNTSIETLVGPVRDAQADRHSRRAPDSMHVIYKSSVTALYNALQGIRTYDLGDQNPVGLPLEYIYDPSVRAIIVAGHSLGNIDNVTRRDLIDAARNGKLVIGTSRSLISATNEAYAASMFTANRELRERGGTEDVIIISARKLNKAAAHAVATRALLEGLNQIQTQTLIDKYCQSRRLT